MQVIPGPRVAEYAEVLVIGARIDSRHGAPLGGRTVPAAPCEVIVCANDTTEEGS